MTSIIIGIEGFRNVHFLSFTDTGMGRMQFLLTQLNELLQFFLILQLSTSHMMLVVRSLKQGPRFARYRQKGDFWLGSSSSSQIRGRSGGGACWTLKHVCWGVMGEVEGMAKAVELIEGRRCQELEGHEVVEGRAKEGVSR